MIKPEKKEEKREIKKKGGDKEEDEERDRGVKGRELEGYKKVIQVMASNKVTERLGLHKIILRICNC